jgi:hypothetical protein
VPLTADVFRASRDDDAEGLLAAVERRAAPGPH